LKLLGRVIGFFIFGPLLGQSGATLFSLGQNQAISSTVFGLSNSPANWGNQKSSVGLWARNRYTGTSLVQGGLAGHLTKSNTAFGADIRYSGTDHFNFSSLHASVGQRFSNAFSAGFCVGISGIRQDQAYGNKYRITGKLAMHLQLTQKVDVGAVLQNPWLHSDPFFADNPEAHMAIGYNMNTVTKSWAHYRYSAEGAIYGLSIQHSFHKTFTVTGTLQTGFEPIAVGVQYKSKEMLLSFSSAYHTYLGFSPAFSIVWCRD
jgi:hypothetical protein